MAEGEDAINKPTFEENMEQIMNSINVCVARSHKPVRNICLVIILLVVLIYLLKGLFSPQTIFSEKLIKLSPWKETHHEKICKPITDNISEVKPMYPIPSLNLYFYGGFVDDRQEPNILRIFGLRRNDTSLDNYYCEWQLKDNSAVITFQVKANWVDIDPRWPKYNRFYAFMITCSLSGQKVGSSMILKTVKIISADKKHNVDVAMRHFPSMISERQLITVCVKPMTGQFSVERLIEWIEIQRAAGINHFVLYNTDVYGAGRFVIEYYKSLGIVIEIYFPYLTAVLQVAEDSLYMDSSLRYALYQQIYLVALHDCLYRFRKSFRYIMYIDIDEVILPINDEPISNMIRRSEIHAPGSASFVFYTTWHYQEFTKQTPKDTNHLHMQTYAWAPRPAMDQPKSILNSDRTLTLNWHGLLDAAPGSNFTRYLLSWWEYGYVHHYRDGQCVTLFQDECKKMIETIKIDQVIVRYRNTTFHSVNKILNHLQL